MGYDYWSEMADKQERESEEIANKFKDNLNKLTPLEISAFIKHIEKMNIFACDLQGTAEQHNKLAKEWSQIKKVIS